MAGRPQVKIDWGEASRLAQAGASGVQISAYFGIHYNTLVSRCRRDNKCDISDFFQQNKSKGDVLILAKQFEAAIKDKDKTMLIWLGKQRLGQKEKFEKDISGGVEIIVKDETNEGE